MKRLLAYVTLFSATLTLTACSGLEDLDSEDTGRTTIASSNHNFDPAAVDRGRDIWFENTYGGEKFFTFLANHPDPEKRIEVGFEAVVETPRDQRFDVWGVINDPDCEADPNGGPDICDDPTATGVVGLRKFPGPGGTTMYGSACAVCHAGFDPLNPPADPNEPTWDNIHATIGNMYLRTGDVFAANLDPTDVRRFMFAAWPQGTVDTTALFNDNIMNPGTITAFWEHPHRPTFDVGMAHEKLRNGQGGEDDVGGDLAALRVYTNIGVCFEECVAGPAALGVPIDIDTCRASCPDFPPQEDLDDLTTFLATFEAPRYPDDPDHPGLYDAGRSVFDHNCARCHDRSGEQRYVLSNDEVNPIADAPLNATNNCRALSSNWEAGNLWAQFSSDVYKARVEAGDRGYRSMPLSGIWSTSPFTHNNTIGSLAPADASPDERARHYWDSMWELLSFYRDPIVHTFPTDFGPIAEGTPLHFVFSRDPETDEILCADLIENRGHHYGAALPWWRKVALIYWLQFQ